MERIKELRLARNMTQKELADMLGVDRTAVVKYETGKNGPTSEILIKLSKIFNVSLEYLLGVDDIKEEEIKKDLTTKYSDEVKKIYEILSELSPENQKKLLELAEMYVENQKNNKGKK